MSTTHAELKQHYSAISAESQIVIQKVIETAPEKKVGGMSFLGKAFKMLSTIYKGGANTNEILEIGEDQVKEVNIDNVPSKSTAATSEDRTLEQASPTQPIATLSDSVIICEVYLSKLSDLRPPSIEIFKNCSYKKLDVVVIDRKNINKPKSPI